MSVVIEGESLLNDGVATVVFRICIVLLQSMSPFYEEFTGEKENGVGEGTNTKQN